MDKRFWISAVVAFMIIFTGAWLTHGMLVHDDYARTPQLFRPPAEASARFPYAALAYALMAFSFTWIYYQGISTGRPWLLQGLRFGLAVTLLAPVPMYLIYYVVQPMEPMTVAKQIIGDGVVLIITGIAIAFISKAKTAVAT